MSFVSIKVVISPHSPPGTGVTTYSLHPGVVKTELFRNFKANCCTMCCIKCLMCCFSCCMKNPDNGALTTIHCAVREGIEGQSGLYFAYVSLYRTCMFYFNVWLVDPQAKKAKYLSIIQSRESFPSIRWMF